MLWDPEPLKQANEIETNCRDFLYGCAEFAAEKRGHERVTLADWDCALAFVNEATAEAKGT